MKGKYEVVVKDARLQYKFHLERNITILRGDSATGKTTLIDMIAAYQQNGENSGVTVRSPKPCVVLTAFNWKMILSTIHDSFVFIDEGNPFVRSEDFAHAVKGSDNYYVIATRSPLPNLPYSVQEIYGIRNKAGNRYQGTKRLYAEFYPLCDTKTEVISKPDLVIVEDSHSGFEFFSHLFKEYGIRCISANSKSNIYSELVRQPYNTALVIADGAAFGPEIERVLSIQKAKNIIIYLPESFEWLILKSALVKEHDIPVILASPSDYIESEKYFSWEQFFTALLIQKTKDSYLQYQKHALNQVYLHDFSIASIKAVMPKLEL